MVVCLLCVSMNCPLLVCIVCVPVSQSMVDGNAYELLLDLWKTKIEQLADEIENIYSDLEQLSRVIMEGHQGDEYDEALSTLAELEDIGWKVRLSRWIPSARSTSWCVKHVPGWATEHTA